MNTFGITLTEEQAREATKSVELSYKSRTIHVILKDSIREDVLIYLKEQGYIKKSEIEIAEEDFKNKLLLYDKSLSSINKDRYYEELIKSNRNLNILYDAKIKSLTEELKSYIEDRKNPEEKTHEEKALETANKILEDISNIERNLIDRDEKEIIVRHWSKIIRDTMK